MIVELAQQTRAAQIAPATANEEQRTIEVVWSTGAAVRRADWMTGKVYVEELSMEPGHVRLGRLNSGAPLLNTHDRFDLRGIIGVVERAWLADGEGRALVRFSRRPEVDPVWRDVLDGVIRNVSIGYRVYRYEEFPGEKPPRLLATDWEPEEVSLVPVGADAGAGVRSAQPAACEVSLAGEEKIDPPATPGRPLSLVRRRLALAERE
jgi:hypothetical protein